MSDIKQPFTIDEYEANKTTSDEKDWAQAWAECQRLQSLSVKDLYLEVLKLTNSLITGPNRRMDVFPLHDHLLSRGRAYGLYLLGSGRELTAEEVVQVQALEKQTEAYIEDLRAETEQLSALSPEAFEEEVLAFLGRLSTTNSRARAKVLHLVARGLDALCVNGVYYYTLEYDK